MMRCFDKLPAERVLIIVFCKMISLGLIDTIAKIRGQRRPLVVDGSTKFDKNSANDREYQIIIRDWLIDAAWKRDLIASSSVIAGFEWPSVLIITSNNFKSQFHIRNIVMRAMSRLVWLKTDSLDEIHEREVNEELVDGTLGRLSVRQLMANWEGRSPMQRLSILPIPTSSLTSGDFFLTLLQKNYSL